MYSKNFGMPTGTYGGATFRTSTLPQNSGIASWGRGQLSCGTTNCRSVNRYIKPPSTVSRQDLVEKYLDLVQVCNSEIDRISVPSTIPNCYPKFTKVSSEIQSMAKDQYFNKILMSAFSEIGSFLDKNDFTYQINVEVEEDIEIPEWNEIVLLIKVPKTSSDNFYQLWETIEGNVRKKIDSIKVDTDSTKKKYDNIVIILDELE